jgi:Family of unknown function (DUF5946)
MEAVGDRSRLLEAVGPLERVSELRPILRWRRAGVGSSRKRHRAALTLPGHRLLAGASLVAMSGATTCPGCGLQLPASGLPWDRRRNASPECWQLYGEVQGLALSHLELVRDFHQLTVDAYAAQHAPREGGGDVPPISVAYALVGLHLALDYGVSGIEIREPPWVQRRLTVSRWQVAHGRAVMVAKCRRRCPQQHGGVAQRAPAGHGGPEVRRPAVASSACRCPRPASGVQGLVRVSSSTRVCPCGRCPVSGAGA